MRAEVHGASSIGAGIGVWAVTGDPLALPVAVAGGVLPDLDHALDYYHWYWRRDFRRVYLFLHSWELVVACYLLAALVPAPWSFALAAGYFTQLALDQFGYRVHWYTYLLAARLLLGFDADRVLPHGVSKGSYRSFTRLLPAGRARAEGWFRSRLDE